MAFFKYDIGDRLETDDDFTVIVTGRGKDPESGVNYYTCRPAKFDSVEREFAEDRLKKQA